MPKVGLVLGGGAARGLAHLGVLLALEESKIPIDLIAGSSVGAVVGSMYAFKPDAKTVIQRVQKYIHSPVFESLRFEAYEKKHIDRKQVIKNLKTKLGKGILMAQSIRNPAIISTLTFHNNLLLLADPAYIEHSKIPLALVAFDIANGEEVVLREGLLIPAMMATSAIPGMFPPIKIGERILMDGSWINPIPCDVAKQMGADIIIGIDVTFGLERHPKLKSGYDLSIRSGEITRFHLKQWRTKDANLMLKVDMMDFHWADFSHMDECVERGYKTAKTALPEIEKLLEAADKNSLEEKITKKSPIKNQTPKLLVNASVNEKENSGKITANKKSVNKPTRGKTIPRKSPAGKVKITKKKQP